MIELFDHIGLEYIYDTDYLFGKRLRPLLPNFNQHLEQQRANRAKENLKKIQAAQTNLANADQDSTGNTLTIDHILEQAKPTLFQQKTIKELIENDLNCRKYFFFFKDHFQLLVLVPTASQLPQSGHPSTARSYPGRHFCQPLGRLSLTWSDCLSLLARGKASKRSVHYCNLSPTHPRSA